MSHITCYYPSQCDTRNSSPVLIPKNAHNGKCMYKPLKATSIVSIDDWEKYGVPISSNILQGFDRQIAPIGQEYYIIGPSYCKHGKVAAVCMSITGKCKSLINVDGPPIWKGAYHEPWEYTIRRKLEEDMGLTIKTECMNNLAQKINFVSHKAITLANVTLTINDITPYDPSADTDIFSTTSTNYRLLDNKNRLVQIIIAIKGDDLEKLENIKYLRQTHNTMNIRGICAIPLARIDIESKFDRYHIYFDRVPKVAPHPAKSHYIRSKIAKGPIHGTNGFIYPRSCTLHQHGRSENVMCSF